MFYRIFEKEKDKNTVLQASSNPHFRIFWDSAPFTPSPDLLSNLLAMLGLILTECYLRKAHEILGCLEVFQNLAFGALYLQVRVATNHKSCGIKSKPQKNQSLAYFCHLQLCLRIISKDMFPRAKWCFLTCCWDCKWCQIIFAKSTLIYLWQCLRVTFPKIKTVPLFCSFSWHIVACCVHLEYCWPSVRQLPG